jgi:hypothetical protein
MKGCSQSIDSGFVLSACVSEIFRRIETLPLAAMAAALFVTAHPDDESMFFAPTILSLVQRGQQVALICLSTGMCWGLPPAGQGTDRAGS